MDVPVLVEATILLNQFQDETKVLQILRSHGFHLSDLGEGQVHVQGYFSELKAVKVRLEQLIDPRTKTTIRSPSPSSGAISKYYNQDTRGRSRTRDEPPQASASPPPSSKLNRPASQDHTAAPPPPPSSSPDHRGSIRTVVVDGDVFRYAWQLRRKHVDSILDVHQVRMQVQENGSSFTITLQGRRSRSAAGDLQKLLDDLSRSLRTQEVPLRDVDQDGKAVLEEIRRNQNIVGSVLVLEVEDGLHLVGPSVESYEVKQRLLGRPGRPSEKNLRNRSSSVPNRKNIERDSRSKRPPGRAAGSSSRNQENQPEAADVPPKSGALRGRSNSETRERKGPERANYKLEPQRGRDFKRPPGGAAGSSSRNQEDEPEAADVPPKSGASRTRSQSEPRRPKEPERSNDVVRKKGNDLLPSKPPRSFFHQLLSWKFPKPTFKKNKKR